MDGPVALRRSEPDDQELDDQELDDQNWNT